MVTYKTDFTLGDDFYFREETPKTQILLMDTHNRDMKHFDEWLIKNPKGYKKTTPFTISVGGDVFKHYDPSYYSEIFRIKEIDSKIIPISLENMGYLTYSKKKNGFINWRGDIYETEEDLYIKNWREQLFWAPYTEKQYESLMSLSIELCEQFHIERRVADHNTHMDFAEAFQGVLYKSNYSKYCRDINPSMKIDKINLKREL